MQCCYRHHRLGVCQFGESQPLIEHGGQQHCYWHLPVAAKENWSQEQVAEFNQKLREYVHQHNSMQTTLDFAGVKFVGHLVHEFDHRDLGDVSFREASFTGSVNFANSTFGKADFTSATFKFNAIFLSAKFKGNASFRYASIGCATFPNVIFCGEADFREATFGKCHFQCVSFLGNANFDSANFTDEVNFYCAAFSKDANFVAPVDQAKATVTASTWWHAVFHGAAHFDNRKFMGTGDFRVKRFCLAPTFHGCTLHQAMMFPSENCFLDTRTEGAAQAYRTLKLGMAAVKARSEEGMFFTLEQRSLRNVAATEYGLKFMQWWLKTLRRSREKVEPNPPIKFSEILLSWGYDKLSDFGRNGVRPLWWVLWSYLFFALVYSLMRGDSISVHASIDMNLVWRGLQFSFEQVLRPFYVWGTNTKTLFESDVLPPSVKVLASIQSILSLMLLSLSLLAINWRFKRD